MKLGEDLPRRLLRPLLWSVLAAVVIYGGSMVLGDIEDVGDSVMRLGVAGWGTVLGLSLVNYGLRFARWEIYLARLDSRVPTLLSAAYYVGGFAFTTTPGKAGEAVRSLYLKRHGVTYVNSLAALFTERLADLVAMFLLALLAATAFPAHRWPLWVLALVVLAILPFTHSSAFRSVLERRVNLIPSERLRTMGGHLLDLLRSAAGLLRSGPLFAGLALALLAWGAEGMGFHIVLRTLDLDVPLALAVGIYSVSVLAGALSFIPGGLGSTEAVMVLLLKLAGADTATALAATLICRLATLWFAVAIGGGVLAVLELTGRSARLEAP